VALEVELFVAVADTSNYLFADMMVIGLSRRNMQPLVLGQVVHESEDIAAWRPAADLRFVG